MNPQTNEASAAPAITDWTAEYKAAQAEEHELMEKLANATRRRAEAERQLARPAE